MRPGRILIFLLAVVLTLFILSLTDLPEKLRSRSDSSDTLPDSAAVSLSDTGSEVFLPDTITADTLYEIIPSDTGEVVGFTPYLPGNAIRDSIARGNQVRILYYGDSQIEGDRVTSLLRRRLREGAGGTGPGLFSPVMPVLYTRSFVVRPSANWARYTLLDHRKGLLPDNSLGPLLSVCRFTTPGDTLKEYTYASVRVTAVPDADTAVAKYDRLRIFYSNNNDTNFVGVASGSRKIAFALLPQGSGPMEYSVALPSVSDLTVEFIGRVSPDIYAFSLESDTGVIVDNIPVRGSAGLEFVMTDSHDFRRCIEMLDPDLIILQYGLNVVRNVRSEYHYYEEGLFKQIEFLKEISGGVPVMLVSLTDMAQKAGDSVRSFTNIPAIRDAQKNAALRSGAIFWDAWESMGGEGSIVKWFNTVPPLASKDLTHLSNAGADTIADRLYTGFFIAETSAISMVDTLKYQADSIIADTVIVTEASPVISQPEEGLTESRPSLLSFIRYHPEQTFIFTTPAFWIFFTVVMAGFALLRRRRQMNYTWLLFVSLYFYYRAGGLFIILLVVTALLTYFTALMIGRSEGRGWKRFWLTSNILILLGFLSYFKYAGFIAETVNAFFNTSFAAYDIFSAWSNTLFGTGFDVTSIVLPVGISFFTFQALSYSIDVYRGRMEPVKNVTDFSFYLTYFPQLVAGPIVRASEFIPQMKGEYTITRSEFGHGLFLIIQGLIKKMLISDFISAGFIDRVFDTPALYSGFENLVAVYGYGLQIYCDFSGYTDIAIGVALLMGFRLPLNFNSPYKATNITDFWKRWHITLSRWLKDYLYIPLGGNRRGPVRSGINLMVTMLIGGLWHGAAARFVLWGGLHGAALVVNKAWQHIFRGVKRRRAAAQLAGFFVTFNFVSFAWIFFRAGSMEEAGQMLTQIFLYFDPGDYGKVLIAYLPVLILIISGYILHFLPITVKEAYRGLFIRLPLAVKFMIVIGTALLLYVVGTNVVQPFIYFRF